MTDHGDRRFELQRGDITVNGLGLSEGQMRYRLSRLLWKQSVDANLNTVDGCEQAATLITNYLCDLDWRWEIPAVELPPWEKRKVPS